MKICLINPPSPFLSEPAMNPQLGLCYLSAFLKAHGERDVMAVDMANGELIPANCDWYYLTGTSPQFKWMKETCRFVKKETHGMIAVGGPHAMACPEDFEGLADEIDESFPINNLIPDREVFGFPKKYKRRLDGKQACHIVTTLGCPYNCNYCAKNSIISKVEFRSIGDIKKELDFIIGSHEITSFVIYDDIFTLNHERVRNLCRKFKIREITWRCWARADTLSKDLLAIMKDAGLHSITIGIESGSQRVLDAINKNCRVQDNINALTWCKELEIPVRCSLMYGTPGESDESLKETLDMIEKCQPDEWNLAVFKPVPGSEFWKHPEKHGLSFDKKRIIENDYMDLNRFDANGVGNVICSVADLTKEELSDRLWPFIKDLETVCPRKDIQDTMQEIKE